MSALIAIVTSRSRLLSIARLSDNGSVIDGTDFESAVEAPPAGEAQRAKNVSLPVRKAATINKPNVFLDSALDILRTRLDRYREAKDWLNALALDEVAEDVIRLAPVDDSLRIKLLANALSGFAFDLIKAGDIMGAIEKQTEAVDCLKLFGGAENQDLWQTGDLIRYHTLLGDYFLIAGGDANKGRAINEYKDAFDLYRRGKALFEVAKPYDAWPYLNLADKFLKAGDPTMASEVRDEIEKQRDKG